MLSYGSGLTRSDAGVRNVIYGGDIPLLEQDYTLLKQFCSAHGEIPDWMRDNPYLEESAKRQDAAPVPVK